MSGPLPTFLIIGAPKSGTSSLWARTNEHPDVFMSPTKEINFFDQDDNWAQGSDWYRAFFQSSQGQGAVGEATPTYLFSNAAPGRMATMLPDARLIAILRDPVERAHSHYLHARYYGLEPRSFGQAVAAELAAPEWDLWPHYLAMSRYAPQLVRLEDQFPRDQLLVLLLDDLRSHPTATLARVFEHIGVTPNENSASSRAENTFRQLRWNWLTEFVNRPWVSRRIPATVRRAAFSRLTRTSGSPGPIGLDLRHRLYETFAPENERLAMWLGRDLSMWSGIRAPAEPSQGR